MKKIILAISFGTVILLASCNDNKKEKQTSTSDTTSIKTPDELKKLNAAIQSNPANAKAFHERAQYYFNSKYFTLAMNDMEQVMKLDSSKAEYFITLSDLYFVTNQTGRAKAALEKCISIDKKNTGAMLKLAELYMYVNKNEQSMEYINMALKIDQYISKAYFMKGMNYKQMKDTAKAISSMQTAVEQDQQYYQAYMQLGLLCAAKKNNLAVDYYKNAIRIQAKSTEAWYGLGKFYQDVKDYSNAIGTYKTLLTFDPTNKYANYNIGAIYLSSVADVEKAMKYFNTAVKIDSKYVEAYYARGVCFQTIKENDRAITEFESCISINPNYEPAQIELKKLKGK